MAWTRHGGDQHTARQGGPARGQLAEAAEQISTDLVDDAAGSVYVLLGVPRGQPKEVPQGATGGNFLGAPSSFRSTTVVVAGPESRSTRAIYVRMPGISCMGVSPGTVRPGIVVGATRTRAPRARRTAAVARVASRCHGRVFSRAMTAATR